MHWIEYIKPSRQLTLDNLNRKVADLKRISNIYSMHISASGYINSNLASDVKCFDIYCEEKFTSSIALNEAFKTHDAHFKWVSLRVTSDINFDIDLKTSFFSTPGKPYLSGRFCADDFFAQMEKETLLESIRDTVNDLRSFDED